MKNKPGGFEPIRNREIFKRLTMLVSAFRSSFTFYVTRGLWSLLFRIKQVLLMAREVACVQTSPLPQEKSGEETSVNRRR